MRKNWSDRAELKRKAACCGTLVGVPFVLSLFADLLREVLTFFVMSVRPGTSLAAENLFLRRQPALYKERGARARGIRVVMVLLSRLFAWHEALCVVQRGTLIRWHRAGFRLLWRLKSRPGCPPIPREAQALIRRMAT